MKTQFKAAIIHLPKQFAKVHLDNLSLTKRKINHCQMIQDFENKNTLTK